MRCSMLVVLGGVVALSAQVFAQGRPADLPPGQRIDDPSRRPLPLEPIPPGRQPGWIDQNAIPAGSQLGPQVAPPDLRDQVSPSAPEIRSYVASLTNAALSPDGFRKAAAMLSDEDRQRLQKGIHADEIRAYDELMQCFQTQWKARYGEEFDLEKQRAVMAEYYVLRGPQPDDPITVGGNLPPGQGQQTVTPRPVQPPADARITLERIATMIVPPNPETQQPAMVLQFRNESNGKPANWRLRTPQSLTGTRLQENLNNRVCRLLDGQAKWPADPREAYRLMSYHVLASMADQPADRPRQDPDQRQRPVVPDNPSLES